MDGSLWDQFIDELETLGQAAAEWLPKVIVALLVLWIGRWLLRIVRRIIERLLSVAPVEGVFDRAGVTAALAPSGRSAASLTAMVAYSVLIVGLWLIVFRILDLQDFVDLLERLLAWIPIVILASAVVIISAAVANWTAALVGPFAERRNVAWLSTVVRIGIILFGVLFAMDILDVTFAEDLVKIAVAAAGIAFAVAFGIGGIDTAKKWWAKYADPD